MRISFYFFIAFLILGPNLCLAKYDKAFILAGPGGVTFSYFDINDLMEKLGKHGLEIEPWELFGKGNYDFPLDDFRSRWPRTVDKLLDGSSVIIFLMFHGEINGTGQFYFANGESELLATQLLPEITEPLKRKNIRSDFVINSCYGGACVVGLPKLGIHDRIFTMSEGDQATVSEERKSALQLIGELPQVEDLFDSPEIFQAHIRSSTYSIYEFKTAGWNPTYQSERAKTTHRPELPFVRIPRDCISELLSDRQR